MAQTLPDVTVTPTWQSINTLTGISVGTKIIIDNKSFTPILLAEGTQPLPDSFVGVPLSSYKDNAGSKVVEAGSLEIWVRVDAVKGVGIISVQEIN